MYERLHVFCPTQGNLLLLQETIVAMPTDLVFRQLCQELSGCVDATHTPQPLLDGRILGHDRDKILLLDKESLHVRLALHRQVSLRHSEDFHFSNDTSCSVEIHRNTVFQWHDVVCDWRRKLVQTLDHRRINVCLATAILSGHLGEEKWGVGGRKEEEEKSGGWGEGESGGGGGRGERRRSESNTKEVYRYGSRNIWKVVVIFFIILPFLHSPRTKDRVYCDQSH